MRDTLILLCRILFQPFSCLPGRKPYKERILAVNHLLVQLQLQKQGNELLESWRLRFCQWRLPSPCLSYLTMLFRFRSFQVFVAETYVEGDPFCSLGVWQDFQSIQILIGILLKSCLLQKNRTDRRFKIDQVLKNLNFSFQK